MLVSGFGFEFFGKNKIVRVVYVVFMLLFLNIIFIKLWFNI